jgi:hypothetical protein
MYGPPPFRKRKVHVAGWSPSQQPNTVHNRRVTTFRPQPLGWWCGSESTTCRRSCWRPLQGDALMERDKRNLYLLGRLWAIAAKAAPQAERTFQQVGETGQTYCWPRRVSTRLSAMRGTQQRESASGQRWTQMRESLASMCMERW